MKHYCHHPNLFPTKWGALEPAPTEMVGCCDKNLICPVCGFGWCAFPHECESKEIEVTHEQFFGENINRAKSIFK